MRSRLVRLKADTTYVIIAIAIAASATVLVAALPDAVKTDAGLISAAVNSPADVRVFRGIPFGAPPVGSLRWKPTQPPAKWDGVRKGDAFGPVCVQPKGVGRLNVSVDMPDSPPASEDCLYLNVWTGATRASERRPVMVWIFGGAYTEGAGSSRHNDGEALANEAMRYRRPNVADATNEHSHVSRFHGDDRTATHGGSASRR